MSLIYSLDENFVDTPDQNVATNRVELNKGQVEKSAFDIPDQVIQTSEVSDVEFRFLKEIGFETNYPDELEVTDSQVAFFTSKQSITVQVLGNAFIIEWGDGTYISYDGSSVYTKTYSTTENRRIRIRKDASSQFNVTSISAELNDITSVDIKNTSTLTKVNFSKNKLGIVTLFNCQNLAELDFSTNLMTQENVDSLLGFVYTQNVVQPNIYKTINCADQPKDILPSAEPPAYYYSLFYQGWVIQFGDLNLYTSLTRTDAYKVLYFPDGTEPQKLASTLGNFYEPNIDDVFPVFGHLKPVQVLNFPFISMEVNSRFDGIQRTYLAFNKSENLNNVQFGAYGIVNDSMKAIGNNGIDTEISDPQRTVIINQPLTLARALGNPQSQLQTAKATYITTPEIDLQRTYDVFSNYFVSNVTQQANVVETFSRFTLDPLGVQRRTFLNRGESGQSFSRNRYTVNNVVQNQLVVQTSTASSNISSTKPFNLEVNDVKLAVMTNVATVYDSSVLFGINQLTQTVYLKAASQPSSPYILGFNGSSELVKIPVTTIRESRLERLKSLKAKNSKLKEELTSLINMVYAKLHN